MTAAGLIFKWICQDGVHYELFYSVTDSGIEISTAQKMCGAYHELSDREREDAELDIEASRGIGERVAA